jgi:hypothetical protein
VESQLKWRVTRLTCVLNDQLISILSGMASSLHGFSLLRSTESSAIYLILRYGFDRVFVVCGVNV